MVTTKLPTTPVVHSVPSLPSNSQFNSPEYRTVKDELISKAARPHPAAWQAQHEWVMSVIHVMIFDLMERIYAFADWAEEHDDLANFLGFAEISIYGIVEHHELEETIIFPQWCQAAGMDIWTRNIEQHHAFTVELDATWLYLRRCRSNLKPTPPPSPVPEPPPDVANLDMSVYPDLDPTKPFSSDALRTHIDTWILSLAHHLNEEILTLAPEHMEKIGEKEIKRIDGEAQKHLQVFDPSWFLCAFMASVDADTKQVLFPLPWFLTWLLIPFWWGPKNYSLWRYCAHPENLTFWGKA